ncbi:class I SAM-dependent methyltransferase [Mariniphaga sp.]|uniref:class I SAM-dependent methyltransferase n=1 Tax=Mariniphaga sp. TaxID=1954475 RepID=UPI0035666ED7
MEPLINYFKDIEVHRILDVGTGRGGFIHVLKKTFPYAKIIGVDPHLKSLEAAWENFPDVSFIEMEAEKLDFDDNSFDVVSISMALHHLPKIKKGLKEIKRVVKPEGYIIINEIISDNLNSAQEVHKMFHHFRSQIDRLTGKFHRKTFTKDAIIQMLKVAELPVQFFFEQRKNVNLVENDADLAEKVNKMKLLLEKIKGRPEYDTLHPQIEEFRTKALKYGFQPATNLVIVIRKKMKA